MIDIDLDLTFVLGSTEMSIKEVLGLGRGAVIPLDKVIEDETVSIFIQKKLYARGKIGVGSKDNLTVTITEIL
jgi:flagellar motor switch protein FliN/FliY|tara:strand:+ start:416 stop:634 length:219 start_codon:yes stop_codon:yes gene_type:complete